MSKPSASNSSKSAGNNENQSAKTSNIASNNISHDPAEMMNILDDWKNKFSSTEMAYASGLNLLTETLKKLESLNEKQVSSPSENLTKIENDSQTSKRKHKKHKSTTKRSRTPETKRVSPTYYWRAKSKSPSRTKRKESRKESPVSRRHESKSPNRTKRNESRKESPVSRRHESNSPTRTRRRSPSLKRKQSRSPFSMSPEVRRRQSSPSRHRHDTDSPHRRTRGSVSPSRRRRDSKSPPRRRRDNHEYSSRRSPTRRSRSNSPKTSYRRRLSSMSPTDKSRSSTFISGLTKENVLSPFEEKGHYVRGPPDTVNPYGSLFDFVPSGQPRFTGFPPDHSHYQPGHPANFSGPPRHPLMDGGFHLIGPGPDGMFTPSQPAMYGPSEFPPRVLGLPPDHLIPPVGYGPEAGESDDFLGNSQPFVWQEGKPWQSDNLSVTNTTPLPEVQSQASLQKKWEAAEEEKRKAVENEKKQQKLTLMKQRQEYIDKKVALRNELDKLSQEKKKLDQDKTSHKQHRWTSENSKEQIELQNKLKAVTNVIEMLSGIIGDDDVVKVDSSQASQPHSQPGAAKRKSGDRPQSRSVKTPPSRTPSPKTPPPKTPPPKTPPRSVSPVKPITSSSAQSGLSENKPSTESRVEPTSQWGNSRSQDAKQTSSSLKSALELLTRVPQGGSTQLKESSLLIKSEPSEPPTHNIIHFDPELHWCRVCNVFPRTAKEYLNHLHSADHKQNLASRHLADMPWHGAFPPEEPVPSNKDGPSKRVPIKGLQFFVSASAWYCKLCGTWIGDLHCASIHLKSLRHSQQFTNFTEKNSQWEVDWLTERTRAYEHSAEDRIRLEAQKQLENKNESVMNEQLKTAAKKDPKVLKNTSKKRRRSSSSESSSSSCSSCESTDSNEERKTAGKAKLKSAKNAKTIKKQTLNETHEVMSKLDSSQHESKKETRDVEESVKLDLPESLVGGLSSLNQKILNECMGIAENLKSEELKEWICELTDKMKTKANLVKSIEAVKERQARYKKTEGEKKLSILQEDDTAGRKEMTDKKSTGDTKENVSKSNDRKDDKPVSDKKDDKPVKDKKDDKSEKNYRKDKTADDKREDKSERSNKKDDRKEDKLERSDRKDRYNRKDDRDSRYKRNTSEKEYSSRNSRSDARNRESERSRRYKDRSPEKSSNNDRKSKVNTSKDVDSKSKNIDKTPQNLGSDTKTTESKTEDKPKQSEVSLTVKSQLDGKDDSKLMTNTTAERTGTIIKPISISLTKPKLPFIGKTPFSKWKAGLAKKPDCFLENDDSSNDSASEEKANENIIKMDETKQEQGKANNEQHGGDVKRDTRSKSKYEEPIKPSQYVIKPVHHDGNIDITKKAEQVKQMFARTESQRLSGSTIVPLATAANEVIDMDIDDEDKPEGSLPADLNKSLNILFPENTSQSNKVTVGAVFPTQAKTSSLGSIPLPTITSVSSGSTKGVQGSIIESGPMVYGQKNKGSMNTVVTQMKPSKIETKTFNPVLGTPPRVRGSFNPVTSKSPLIIQHSTPPRIVQSPQSTMNVGPLPMVQDFGPIPMIQNDTEYDFVHTLGHLPMVQTSAPLLMVHDSGPLFQNAGSVPMIPLPMEPTLVDTRFNLPPSSIFVPTALPVPPPQVQSSNEQVKRDNEATKRLLLAKEKELEEKISKQLEIIDNMNKAKKEELNDLAMLGIDADDQAVQKY